MSLNITADGSPTPRKAQGRFANMVADQLVVDTSPEVLGAVGSGYPNSKQYPAHYWPSPLTSRVQGVKRPLNITTTRGNIGRPLDQPPHSASAVDGFKVRHVIPLATAQLTSHQKIKCGDDQNDGAAGGSVVDSLLQRLSEQSSSPLSRGMDSVGLPSSAHPNSSQAKEYATSSGGSVPITPATDEFPPPDSAVVVDANELHLLRKQLADARSEVARMNQELHTSAQIKATLDHAVGQSSEADYYYKGGEVTEQTISQLQSKFNASTRPAIAREESWPPMQQEDGMSEKSDTKAFGQAIWNNGARQQPYQTGWGVNSGFGAQVCQCRRAYTAETSLNSC